MKIPCHLLVAVIWLVCCTAAQTLRSSCPHLYRKTFRGFLPRGNLSAGSFVGLEDVTDVKTCTTKCCVNATCNVAFQVDEKCYHITCASSELCAPVRTDSQDPSKLSMVLVRPVYGEESWTDVIRTGEEETELYSDEYKNPLATEESDFDFARSRAASCSLGGDDCLPDEECIQKSPKSRAGTCECRTGYVRDGKGLCTSGVHNNDSVTSTVTKKPLIVSAESQTLKLPTSDATLTALVKPDAPDGVEYRYDWTLLQQPVGSTAIKHQNGEKLQVSELSEGTYTFKIGVSGEDDSYGQTYVNLTVLPPSRVNRPPQIVITPANQTIKLPNTGAVLDASSSTDDDGIVSWHWELQQGPLGYQPQLTETPTLQLHDLSRPGSYAFKLTVTDTDKETNSSIANITVLQVTDYPPEANAGQNVIIYLPQNRITLNGNLSTDDHAITTWEWTKSAGDADKAVDMRDTRSPYLRLSDLEEGMYTFVLKVTDAANQSGTAEVHVFVKPPTNRPPVANAGRNVTISLPQTWVVLSADRSEDDNGIVSYLWEQVEGATDAVFSAANSSTTNVTGLTKGRYVFRVTVTDDSKNAASDRVAVIVEQNKNEKPVADAGGDFEVELPRTAIYVNGSKSSDDWAVVKWKWTRRQDSLAAGSLAEGSDERSVLILVDAVVGKYKFDLTVYDKQGLSDTDTVTVTVKNDPKLFYTIEITVATDTSSLTRERYDTIKGKLGLFVKDGTKLKVRNVRAGPGIGNSVISFYVEKSDGKPMDANLVVRQMREKLQLDRGLLGFSVVGLKTAVCQNDCSGHGVCDEETRKCICEAFWMQNSFKVYFGSEQDSDCEWSILYVMLAVMCSVAASIGSFWGAIYLCSVWCARRKSSVAPNTYKLIENSDEPPYLRKGNAVSDSDTDSDVVFESRTTAKSRFGMDARNPSKLSKNGFSRTNRRIKT